jgi:predicted PurR-regulated permease PerM
MSDHEAHTTNPVTTDWGSRSHIQTFVIMAVIGFGIYLCYRLTQPFLPALAWALGLAVIFAPFQRWLESKLRHPSLAASVSVLVARVRVCEGRGNHQGEGRVR